MLQGNVFSARNLNGNLGLSNYIIKTTVPVTFASSSSSTKVTTLRVRQRWE